MCLGISNLVPLSRTILLVDTLAFVLVYLEIKIHSHHCPLDTITSGSSFVRESNVFLLQIKVSHQHQFQMHLHLIIVKNPH